MPPARPPSASVSVIIPTKNERHNLPAHLDSIPSDVEVILCDASDDGTLELARRLRADNLICLSDTGTIAQARNLGACHASGRLLVFSDADVVFDSGYWTQIQTFDSNIDGVCGPKYSRTSWSRYYQLVGASQKLFSERLGIVAASGSNMVIRRECFRSLGGFRPQLSCNEDTELFLRAGRLGYSVSFDPDLIVWATDHRRLDRGVTSKSVHSLLRNALIYATCDRARLPRILRSDWSYWSTPHDERSHRNDDDCERCGCATTSQRRSSRPIH